MSPSEVARLRQERVKEATDLFEKQPGYAKAELEFLQRGAALNERVDFQVKVVGSPERMEHALAWLDLWAETHLDLVSDMELQKAFQTLVWNNLQYNWQQFTGRMYDEFPPQVYPGPGDRFKERANYWITEGYKRVVEAAPHPAPAQSVPTSRVFGEPQPELLKNQEYVNRKKAAAALGITTRTLDRWTADRKLIPRGAGSRKTFRVKDLLRLISQKKEGQERQE